MDGIETKEDMAKLWIVVVFVGAIALAAGIISSNQVSNSEAPYRFDPSRSYVSVPARVLKRTPNDTNLKTYSLSVETPAGILSIQPWGVSDSSSQKSIDSLVEGDCVLINQPDVGALSTQSYLRLHNTLISPVDCRILDEYKSR